MGKKRNPGKKKGPKEKKKKKRCPRCGKKRVMTEHHILPKRFKKRWKYMGVPKNKKIKLCRMCHDELEALIPIEDVQTVKFYFATVKKFLKERSMRDEQRL